MTSDTELTTRLERLECSNRRLKLSLAAVGVIFLLSAAEGPKPDVEFRTVRAQRLIVGDFDRANLMLTGDGNGSILVLRDGKGRPRIELSTSDEQNANIVIKDEKGTQRVRADPLGLQMNGTRADFFGGNGQLLQQFPGKN